MSKKPLLSFDVVKRRHQHTENFSLIFIFKAQFVTYSVKIFLQIQKLAGF